MRKGRARRTAGLLAVLASPLLLAEAVSYAAARHSHWFDDWEYVTVGDPEAGFSLRPGVHSRWTGANIFVNRSGLRDARRDRSVAPRSGGELLILSAGDSNTFGNGVEYQETYSARLARRLAERVDRPVRVLNLGVSGYSSYQSAIALDRWLRMAPEVLILADSFNNRAIGPPDSPESLRRARESRSWEFGRWIWFSALMAARLTRPDPGPPPSLEEPLPAPRLSLPEYRAVLEGLLARASARGARTILFATGDAPGMTRRSRPGMRHLASGNWREAERSFRELVRSHPDHFLGWYQLHRAVLEQGDSAGAAAVRADYADSGAGRRYLSRVASYADPYVAVMEEVAEGSGATFLDLRPSFRAEGIGFHDICHYRAAGHAVIAAALTEAVLRAVGWAAPRRAGERRTGRTGQRCEPDRSQRAARLLPGAPVGEEVHLHHGLPGDAEGQQGHRGAEAGPILAGGAVEQRG